MFLEIQGLSKAFKRSFVLQDISLSLNKGEVFGLIGPNGAGKTTLIKCILGLLIPDKGKIIYKNRPLDFPTIQSQFSFLPERFFPYPQLTAWEFLSTINLSFASPLEVNEILKKVGLFEVRHRKIGKFSRGMIQRLGLALVLSGDAEVIFLDEPLEGLDPLVQKQMTESMKALKQQGYTILLCSHILFPIKEVCDRVGIIFEGKLKFVGTLEELFNKHNTSILEEAFFREIGGGVAKEN